MIIHHFWKVCSTEIIFEDTFPEYISPLLFVKQAVFSDAYINHLINTFLQVLQICRLSGIENILRDVCDPNHYMIGTSVG